ncbi:hypothetical protein ILYODFUR_013451 [Ilyodon furcidens]|uniref:Uncharacterized protein n=1 Tax=Ilyodon furcidens TaxID=33524 RepID=A0ABV0V4R4_9TELE
MRRSDVIARVLSVGRKNKRPDLQPEQEEERLSLFVSALRSTLLPGGKLTTTQLVTLKQTFPLFFLFLTFRFCEVEFGRLIADDIIFIIIIIDDIFVSLPACLLCCKSKRAGQSLTHGVPRR